MTIGIVDEDLRDADLDDVMKDLKPKKRIQKGRIKGKLTNHRAYLAGPIDNAKDDGVGWRQLATPYLQERGIQILDPTDKPTPESQIQHPVKMIAFLIKGQMKNQLF